MVGWEERLRRRRCRLRRLRAQGGRSRDRARGVGWASKEVVEGLRVLMQRPREVDEVDHEIRRWVGRMEVMQEQDLEPVRRASRTTTSGSSWRAGSERSGHTGDCEGRAGAAKNIDGNVNMSANTQRGTRMTCPFTVTDDAESDKDERHEVEQTSEWMLLQQDWHRGHIRSV